MTDNSTPSDWQARNVATAGPASATAVSDETLNAPPPGTNGDAIANATSKAGPTTANMNRALDAYSRARARSPRALASETAPINPAPIPRSVNENSAIRELTVVHIPYRSSPRYDRVNGTVTSVAAIAISRPIAD